MRGIDSGLLQLVEHNSLLQLAEHKTESKLSRLESSIAQSSEQHEHELQLQKEWSVAQLEAAEAKMAAVQAEMKAKIAAMEKDQILQREHEQEVGGSSSVVEAADALLMVP